MNIKQIIVLRIKKDCNFTSDNGTVTTYDYVNGVEYKNNILQRIAHTEGSVSVQTDGSYAHEYVLRDHLGNTRVTFSDLNNDGLVGATDIKQINAYYPFGLNMESNFNGAAGKNKYAYNGKEWNDDFGLGMNDYGRRMYDPAIGRFGVIDRFATKYQDINPYQYGGNNPIKFIDVNGDSIKPAAGQKAQFVAEFNQVISKLNEIGEGGNYKQLNDSKTVYKLKETSGTSGAGGSRFDPKTNTIYWNPRMGLINNNTLIAMSPATVLAHELEHGARYARDKKGSLKDLNTFDANYNNKEERRVVEGTEQRVARKLNETKEGEVTRLDHGQSPIITNGPLSTETPDTVIDKKIIKN